MRRVTKENPSILTEGLQEKIYMAQLELNKRIALIIP
jgi:hypothetical protein